MPSIVARSLIVVFTLVGVAAVGYVGYVSIAGTDSVGSQNSADSPEPSQLESNPAPDTDTPAAPTTVPAKAETPVAATMPDGSGDVDLTALPLGDQKFSTYPRVGYIFSCQSSFGGGGSSVTGDWIDINGGVYDATGKVVVDGSNSWPNATISVSSDGLVRTITGNGVPTTHTTGDFPISQNDDAYYYDRNPNTITTQSVSYRLPALPVVAASPTCLSLGAVGIAVNGVAIFNGFDAGGRDAVAYEVQDHCDGHPEQNGEYHYHSGSRCFKDVIDATGHSAIFGYALDGFGIFGYQSGGTEVTNADLDECHGHTHTVTWDGQTRELYHYHLTYEYPYTLGCFRGKADQPAHTPGGSVPTSGPTGTDSGPAPGGSGGGAPPEATAACSGKSSGASCSFSSPMGDTISGSCQNTQDGLACVPTDGPPPR